MIDLPIVPLFPRFQYSSWGQKSSLSTIQRLYSPPTSDTPCAEAWFGSHSNGSSTIEGGGSLKEFLSNHRASFPPHGELSFLMKILSIGEPLSIQVHPSRDLAQQLHRQDPTNYPDSNHKPEIGLALSKVEILSGFQDEVQIRRALEIYPQLKELFHNVDGSSSSFLQASCEAVFRSSPALRARTILTLQDPVARNAPPWEKWFQWAIENYGAEDAGIFGFFLLNYVVLNPGEVIFSSAGSPHAYLSGEVVECMALSDNTIRGGLTHKHTDPEAFLKAVRYESLSQDALLLSPTFSPGILRYTPPVEEFEFEVLSAGPSIRLPGSRPQMLLSINGKGAVASLERRWEFNEGGALLIGQTKEFIDCHISDGTVYRATFAYEK
jgi:mannose-6-phosphate isomerase